MAELTIYGKTFREITLDDMIDYIEAKAPNDKKTFKEEAFKDKNGNTKKTYQHFSAVKWFCGNYDEFKHLIPKAKPKTPNKSERLKNW